MVFLARRKFPSPKGIDNPHWSDVPLEGAGGGIVDEMVLWYWMVWVLISYYVLLLSTSDFKIAISYWYSAFLRSWGLNWHLSLIRWIIRFIVFWWTLILYSGFPSHWYFLILAFCFLLKIWLLVFALYYFVLFGGKKYQKPPPARRHRPSLKASAIGDRLWPTATAYFDDPLSKASAEFYKATMLL